MEIICCATCKLKQGEQPLLSESEYESGLFFVRLRFSYHSPCCVHLWISFLIKFGFGFHIGPISIRSNVVVTAILLKMPFLCISDAKIYRSCLSQ